MTIPQQIAAKVAAPSTNGKVAPEDAVSRTEAVNRVRAARGCLKDQPGSVTEFLKEKRAEAEREA